MDAQMAVIIDSDNYEVEFNRVYVVLGCTPSQLDQVVEDNCDRDAGETAVECLKRMGYKLIEQSSVLWTGTEDGEVSLPREV